MFRSLSIPANRFIENESRTAQDFSSQPELFFSAYNDYRSKWRII